MEALLPLSILPVYKITIYNYMCYNSDFTMDPKIML